ncbi:MAG: helix-turn-helix domain-containing protein [Lachnospiraceae bacterium]|nr:helix-turn-helix domain-containing protein [Lachnospiraceae bacterium]
MTIKEKLQEHIKKNGLKKSFVAEQIGISSSKLSNYLHGKLILVDDTESKIEKYLEQHN